MKRFFSVLIFVVGMIPVSALAESGHTPDGSKLKRAVSEGGRGDFASRAYNLANACDTVRPGTAAGTGTGGLLEAQLPSGSVNDLLSGSTGKSSGAAGDATKGKSLFDSSCKSCHGAKSPQASIAILEGSRPAPGSMAGALSSMSSADKQAIIAYLRTL